jgi:hypothetical protein
MQPVLILGLTTYKASSMLERNEPVIEKAINLVSVNDERYYGFGISVIDHLSSIFDDFKFKAHHDGCLDQLNEAASLFGADI